MLLGVLLGGLLLGASVLCPPPVEAQAHRVTYRYIAATQEWLPYIRWSTYQNISLNGGATFKNLLATPSLDTLTTRLSRSGLGSPREVQQKDWGNVSDVDYTATLLYDGATIKVRKRRGTVLIETLLITSEAHYLEINSKKIRPGTETDRLSKETRKGMDDWGVSIRVAEEVEEDLSGVSQVRGISLYVSEDGAHVTKIRFHRIV